MTQPDVNLNFRQSASSLAACIGGKSAYLYRALHNVHIRKKRVTAGGQNVQDCYIESNTYL